MGTGLLLTLLNTSGIVNHLSVAKMCFFDQLSGTPFENFSPRPPSGSILIKDSFFRFRSTADTRATVLRSRAKGRMMLNSNSNSLASDKKKLRNAQWWSFILPKLGRWTSLCSAQALHVQSLERRNAPSFTLCPFLHACFLSYSSAFRWGETGQIKGGHSRTNETAAASPIALCVFRFEYLPAPTAFRATFANVIKNENESFMTLGEDERRNAPFHFSHYSEWMFHTFWRMN